MGEPRWRERARGCLGEDATLVQRGFPLAPGYETAGILPLTSITGLRGREKKEDPYAKQNGGKLGLCSHGNDH